MSPEIPGQIGRPTRAERSAAQIQVVPGRVFSLLVLLLAVTYWRFLLHLPFRSRMLFLTSAVVYVGGALGMEMVGGWYAQNYGSGNLSYVAIATLEETLEMLGVVIFIYALLRYLAAEIGAVRLVFGDAAEGISGPP